MVSNRNGKDEGQHPDVVHGPDACAHGDCPAHQPRGSSPPAGGRYSGSQIERRIRCDDGDQNRQRNKRIVVGTHQVHSSHPPPFGYRTEHTHHIVRFPSEPTWGSKEPVRQGTNTRSKSPRLSLIFAKRAFRYRPIIATLPTFARTLPG